MLKKDKLPAFDQPQERGKTHTPAGIAEDQWGVKGRKWRQLPPTTAISACLPWRGVQKKFLWPFGEGGRENAYRRWSKTSEESLRVSEQQIDICNVNQENVTKEIRDT